MRFSKDALIKDTVVYTAANYISLFIGFFIAILSRRFLGVAGAGYWSLLSVGVTYGMFANLGIGKALIRELPKAISAGDAEKARDMQDGVFTFILFSSAAIMLVACAVSLFFRGDPVLRSGIIIVGPLIFVTQFYNFMIVILRSHNKIYEVGRLIVLNSVIVGIVSLLGARFFHVSGYAAGQAAGTLISYCLAMRWSGIKVSLTFKWRLVSGFVKVGLVMLGASMLLKVFLTVDKIVIGKVLGVGELGFYSIGIMAVQQLGMLPRFFNIIVFPYVQELYGRNGRISDIEGIIMRPTHVMVRLAPVMTAAVIFLMEPIVRYALPQFVPGLTAMKILAFGNLFVITKDLFETVIFTIDKQNILVVFYSVLIALCAILDILFISAGMGIAGVALGTSLAYLLMFLLVCGYALKFFLPWRRMAGLYSEMGLCYAYFILNFLWIDAFIVKGGYIGAAVMKLLCLGLVSIPVLISLERREHIFSSGFRVVRTQLQGLFA